MYLRIRFPVLLALVGAALLALACTESLGPPGRRALRAPQVAAAVASGIALDQVNSTMGLNGTILLKGFNPTNPHLGDAIALNNDHLFAQQPVGLAVEQLPGVNHHRLLRLSPQTRSAEPERE